MLRSWLFWQVGDKRMATPCVLPRQRQVKAIRHGQQPWGVRIVVDLDRLPLSKSGNSSQYESKKDKGQGDPPIVYQEWAID